jgi:hypothetical protein
MFEPARRISASSTNSIRKLRRNSRNLGSCSDRFSRAGFIPNGADYVFSPWKALDRFVPPVDPHQ